MGKQITTFGVGSLIDPHPGDYVAICDRKTGKILRHENWNNLFSQTQVEEPETEPVEEIINPAQIKLF